MLTNGRQKSQNTDTIPIRTISTRKKCNSPNGFTCSSADGWDSRRSNILQKIREVLSAQFPTFSHYFLSPFVVVLVWRTYSGKLICSHPPWPASPCLKNDARRRPISVPNRQEGEAPYATTVHLSLRMGLCNKKSSISGCQMIASGQSSRRFWKHTYILWHGGLFLLAFRSGPVRLSVRMGLNCDRLPVSMRVCGRRNEAIKIQVPRSGGSCLAGWSSKEEVFLQKTNWSVKLSIQVSVYLYNSCTLADWQFAFLDPRSAISYIFDCTISGYSSWTIHCRRLRHRLHKE